MNDIEFIATPNQSKRSSTVQGIILHYTAGGDINGTIKWFQMPESQSSSHYVVSRSGRIVQMVGEDLKAWHAGSSTTTPQLNGKKNINDWSIGIEICNWGFLYECNKSETIVVDGKSYKREPGNIYTPFRQWTYKYGGEQPKRILVDSVAIANSKFYPNGSMASLWEPFPAVQVDAVTELLKDILTRHPITKEWIARHQDVDPTRKSDTGPAFPFESVIAELFPEPKETVAAFQIDRRNDETATINDMHEMYEPRNAKKSFFCL